MSNEYENELDEHKENIYRPKVLKVILSIQFSEFISLF